jgi:hypothetical protein
VDGALPVTLAMRGIGKSNVGAAQGPYIPSGPLIKAQSAFWRPGSEVRYSTAVNRRLKWSGCYRLPAQIALVGTTLPLNMR